MMRDGKPLILCVDDDPDILESLELVLEANGYAVARAPSAEKGLRLYEEERPELVIVDLMMEEVDAGTTFVKDLHARGAPPPIYMLSSVGDQLHLSIDSSDLGLCGVIQKPVSPDSLLAIVRANLT